MAAYLKNAWYMVAWEEEVPERGFLTRTILDKPMMFFRRAEGGGFVAMVDRCPHRFAPLSLGARDGDNVTCGYHGLTFNAEGDCIRNPFSDITPPHCRVETFRLVAKDTILWIWGGDPATADEALIADCAFLSAADFGRGHLVFEANFELLTDNLMDLSHIEFVHKGTFGGGGVIFRGEHTTKEEGDAIWSNWWMPETRPPWATFLPPEMKTDHWLDMRWQAPATMVLEIGLQPAGIPRGQAPMPPMRQPHIITPQSQTSSHYFYAANVGTGQDDAIGKAFKDEDQPMIEAVQRSMGDADFWGMRPAILHVDSAAIRARRRLEQMRKREAEPAV